jgi:hypothetical protein
MVKIHFVIIRKQYKNKVYEYEQVTMHFPKDMHDFLRCLRNRHLQIKAKRKGKTTHIMLIDNEDQ